MRLLLFILLTPIALTGLCTAAPVTFLDAPEVYTPGQSFAFDVIMPGTTKLSAYQIDVTLTSNSGTAGTDFLFDNASVASPASGYVFLSNQEFVSATDFDSTTTQRLILTDFDLAGRDTIGGENDRIATISVQTSASFTGVLELAIDPAALILDGPELTPTPVPEFSAIQSDTFNQSSILVSAVPEPSGIAFLALIVGGMAASTRKRLVGR